MQNGTPSLKPLLFVEVLKQKNFLALVLNINLEEIGQSYEPTLPYLHPIAYRLFLFLGI